MKKLFLIMPAIALCMGFALASYDASAQDDTTSYNYDVPVIDFSDEPFSKACDHIIDLIGENEDDCEYVKVLPLKPKDKNAKCELRNEKGECILTVIFPRNPNPGPKNPGMPQVVSKEVDEPIVGADGGCWENGKKVKCPDLPKINE